MKSIGLSVMLLFSVMACKNETSYASFGEKITADNVLSSAEMMAKYETLKAGDTIQAKVKADIIEVCSKKGCWMTLDMKNDKEAMVRFKDYGFFMPLNAEGEVIVNGKAFVTEISVDELRHYAEDAGKPQSEIDTITEPKRTFAFQADGVLLKK